MNVVPTNFERVAQVSLLRPGFLPAKKALRGRKAHCRSLVYRE
jgi:hypothetical protein